MPMLPILSATARACAGHVRESTRIGRRWLLVAFLAGAVSGVALALAFGSIFMLVADRLLWLIPLAGITGLVLLAGTHVLLERRARDN